MQQNYFYLSNSQLVKTYKDLEEKIQEGLQADEKELRCLPTYIIPEINLKDENVLVLDLGGTNFRAAIVSFEKEKYTIEKMEELELKTIMTQTPGIERDTFFNILIEVIERLGNLDTIKKVGYCFSYPCENDPKGDAKLIKWTKGVTVKDMVGELVGEPLRIYLNKKLGLRIETVKVINDTVAALYSGFLDKHKYDAYIGLIVGTGTNMATLYPVSKVPKIAMSDREGEIAINLESGNYNPPYGSVIDEILDEKSPNRGDQRFEKRVSGGYLGQLLADSFPMMDFSEGFNAKDLTYIMSNTDLFQPELVKTADRIYERSAQLVAASIAGLIDCLISAKDSIEEVCIVAEGGLFYSTDKNSRGIRRFKSYQTIVEEELNSFLEDSTVFDRKIQVKFIYMPNANLWGSAIAAISPSF